MTNELDVTSPGSAKRDDEDLESWLAKIAPHCLEVEDGETIEDVIPKLARIGVSVPPAPDEPASTWLARIRPNIDAANADP